MHTESKARFLCSASTWEDEQRNYFNQTNDAPAFPDQEVESISKEFT